MFWRGIIIGLALGVWIASLALWALWTGDDDRGDPDCAAACCGCAQNQHGHPPPVNVAWAPPGTARYFCGRSDHGGGFLWDHAGGYLWDHGAGYLWDHGGGYLWDHGGGFVWDHGGGYVWDHGGGFVWDHGGGFVWDSGLAQRQPMPGSPAVPVPGDELAAPRADFEYRCATGNGGINDVSVVREGVKVSIVMPDGNVDFMCTVGPDGEAVIEPRADADPEPDVPTTDRAYCMVAEGAAHEIAEPGWAP